MSDAQYAKWLEERHTQMSSVLLKVALPTFFGTTWFDSYDAVDLIKEIATTVAAEAGKRGDTELLDQIERSFKTVEEAHTTDERRSALRGNRYSETDPYGSPATEEDNRLNIDNLVTAVNAFFNLVKRRVGQPDKPAQDQPQASCDGTFKDANYPGIRFEPGADWRWTVYMPDGRVFRPQRPNDGMLVDQNGVHWGGINIDVSSTGAIVGVRFAIWPKPIDPNDRSTKPSVQFNGVLCGGTGRQTTEQPAFTPGAVTLGPGTTPTSPATTPTTVPTKPADDLGPGTVSAAQAPCDGSFKDPRHPGVRVWYDESLFLWRIEFADGERVDLRGGDTVNDHKLAQTTSVSFKLSYDAAQDAIKGVIDRHDPGIGGKLEHFDVVATICGRGPRKPGPVIEPVFESVRMGPETPNVTTDSDPQKGKGSSGSSAVQDMIASPFDTPLIPSGYSPARDDAEDSRARSLPHSWGTLREIVAAWFHVGAPERQPSALASARTERLTPDRSALPAGAVVRIERGQGAPSIAGRVVVSLVATGASSGVAFQLQVVNGLARPLRLNIPDGLVLRPLSLPASRSAVAATKRPSTTHALSAYCLDFAKDPPAAGTVFQVAEPSLQRRHGLLRHVLEAARTLSAEGRLHPDVDAKLYDDAIRQWALWTRIEKWSFDQYVNNLVERGKKNVREMKRSWTRQMEDALRAAAPARWRDINQVLELADRLEKAAAPKPSAQ